MTHLCFPRPFYYLPFSGFAFVDARTATKLQVQQREVVSFYGGGTSPAPLLEASDKNNSC